MGCKSTSMQILRLMSSLKVEGKNILELGYLPNSSDIDFKKYFVKLGSSFYRTNLTSSNDTDFSWDLHESLPASSPIKKFDCIICSSIMEHVACPWIAAKNIEQAISPQGLLIWTTPWVWRIHGYPSDYWRFTPNAVKELFSLIEWTWEGYEITDGKNHSILIDTKEWEKDAGIRCSNLDKLINNFPTFLGDMNIRSKTVVVARNEEVKKLTLKTNADKFVYEFISTKLRPVWSPMSNFIMIGKKLK